MLYYDSITTAAAAFGCSRQWLSKLIASGQLIAYDIPGQPQAKRVWHAHVAEALSQTGGLGDHADCICYSTGRQQGSDAIRQESAALLEELAQVKADRDKAQEDASTLRQEAARALDTVEESAAEELDEPEDLPPPTPSTWETTPIDKWTTEHWRQARSEMSLADLRIWRLKKIMGVGIRP